MSNMSLLKYSVEEMFMEDRLTVDLKHEITDYGSLLFKFLLSGAMQAL